MSELEAKLQKVRALLDERGLDALFLQRVSSFAWVTCGAASYINTATSNGEASALITKNGRYLITNNIEAPHYEREEQLKAQGWDFQIGPWYQPSEAFQKLTGGMRVGADGCLPGAEDMSAEVSALRMNLLPEEQERYREVSRLCAEAMEAAARAVRPGMNEYEIAGLLAKETFDRQVQPIVNLIATDQRIFDYRHPLPQDKKLEKYAMLVLCGRRYGLVTSVTRLVHFGPLSDELKRKQDAVTQVDAQVIAATRPGKSLDEMFAAIQAAYASAGFAGEYELHHQGGPAGYEPREVIATPSAKANVAAGQAYAWNPSITGIKTEDTILVTEDGCEVMTEMAGWPMTEVDVPGGKLRRPLILVND
jgi:Xaa-Pro aminopeptidase